MPGHVAFGVYTHYESADFQLFQTSFVDTFLVGDNGLLPFFGDRNPFGSITTLADEIYCATIVTCRVRFGVRVTFTFWSASGEARVICDFLSLRPGRIEEGEDTGRLL